MDFFKNIFEAKITLQDAKAFLSGIDYKDIKEKYITGGVMEVELTFKNKASATEEMEKITSTKKMNVANVYNRAGSVVDVTLQLK